MKRALLIAALGISMNAIAQEPIIDSWTLNATGETGRYDVGAGTVNMPDSANVKVVCYTTSNVYIKCEGLADYIMGPFPGNPNTPNGQNYSFKFPRNPSVATTKTAVPLHGPLGVAVNGVVIYGYGDGRSYDSGMMTNEPNGDGNWNADAWVSEGSTMDANGNGHPDMMGNYHYHANPIDLYDDPSTTHSPIIGYAFDGYPIYGPFGHTIANDTTSPIKRIASSYQLRSGMTNRDTLPDGSLSIPAGPAIGGSFPLGTYIEDYEYVMGSGDLDEYNGRQCITPEYPNATYAYYMTTDSVGDPAFPYMMAAEYNGNVSPLDVGPNAGSSAIPGSSSCNPSGIGLFDNDPLAVWPVPANDVINIRSAGMERLVLVDVLGQVRLTKNVSGNLSHIDLADLPPGAYVLLIQGKEQVSLTVVKD